MRVVSQSEGDFGDEATRGLCFVIVSQLTKKGYRFLIKFFILCIHFFKELPNLRGPG